MNWKGEGKLPSPKVEVQRLRRNLGPGSNPIFSDVYGRAQAQSTKPMTYYPGQTVAGFAPEQSLAQELTTSRALMGSPVQKAGQDVSLATLTGQYMDPASNPWLAKTFEEAATGATKKFGEATLPQLRSGALAQGAFGGSRLGIAEGMASQALADELGSIATGIYGPAYQQERGLQQQAMMAAPQLAEAEYSDIGKLAGVGEEKQTMEQALIDAAMKAWNFYQQEPWERMGMFSNLITGDVGGTTMGSYSGK